MSTQAFFGRFVERLGWVAVVLSVGYTAVGFGFTLGYVGLDQLLHGRSDSPVGFPWLMGIELVIVPLIAITPTRLRPGVERIRAVRETRGGPFLPLLLAATLVATWVYVPWSWTISFQLEPALAVAARCVGVILLATITIVWLPLFPRVIALQAGMIAGPAVFAGLGYLFFESFLAMPPPPIDAHECFGGLVLGLFLFVAVPVLSLIIGVPLWLWRGDYLRQVRPSRYALIMAVLAVGLAVLGTRNNVDGCYVF